MNSPINPTEPQGQHDASQATPASRPGPKPGPRPGARPGARPGVVGSKAASPAAAPAVQTKSPADCGRVDADGTAWVIGVNGEERQIGEFKAGTPEEGLKHFINRFENLATEVSLLEARLRSHPEEAQQLRKDATSLRESLSTATVIGDLPALNKRLSAFSEQSVQAEQQANQDKEARREKAIARKEELAAEAEQIGENSTEWKAGGDRLRAILDEWKSIRGVDRATDDALWKRYSAGRDAFSRRRGTHFSDLDRNRGLAKQKKEEIVERAEALQDSTDWAQTAGDFKGLMREWKAAGRATREADDQLWDRFKAAQDKFFEAKKADAASKDAEFEVNAGAKQKLLDEYDSLIDPAQGIDRARQQLRELQDKWEQIGFVPRARVREFEDKIGNLEQRVTDAADAEWRRTDPEAQARVAQFQTKVDQFTAEAEAAEAKGNAKKAATLREQAAQWQEWAQAASSATEN